MKNIKVSPNQTPESSIAVTPITLVDRPPVLLINAPKPPPLPLTPQLDYKDDKATGMEDFKEIPKEKSHCGLYTAYCSCILLYTIICFVIYTFILYAIGIYVLKVHYHITVDGKTLTLNSLDVLKYPGVYSVFSSSDSSVSRELDEDDNINIINSNNIRNSLNKIKASTNVKKTALIDSNNNLFLKIKGLETTDINIDGNTKMLGDVTIGDLNHRTNLKINGTIDVQSIKVNKVIDISDATLKYNAPDPSDKTNSFQNISIGQLDAKVINVQSTLCNITANNITNINDLIFIKPNIITVRSGNLVLKGDLEGNGIISMLTPVDVSTVSTEYLNIGLKNSEKKINIRGDVNSITNVINLESDYITSSSIKVGEISSVYDYIKMKNPVDMDGNILKTTKIQNLDTIQTLNIKPLDDKNFISLNGINILSNNEMTNILKLRTTQLFADEFKVSLSGSISIKSNLNLNDNSITNVKNLASTNLDVTKLTVNSITAKDATSSIIFDSNIFSNKILKIYEIDPINVGNRILIKGDIDVSNKAIVNVVDTQTNKLTVSQINSKNTDGSPIVVSSGMKFASTVTAGILNVETIQKNIGGGGVINVNSDLNLDEFKLTTDSITLNSIMPKNLDTLNFGTTTGTITINGNVKFTGRISDTLNLNNIAGINTLQGIDLNTAILIESPLKMSSKNIDLDGNSIINVGTISANIASSIAITSDVNMENNKLTVKEISSNADALKFANGIKISGLIEIKDNKINGLSEISNGFEVKGKMTIGAITIDNNNANPKIDMGIGSISNLKTINGNGNTLEIEGITKPKSLILPQITPSQSCTVGSLGYDTGKLYFCDGSLWRQVL